MALTVGLKGINLTCAGKQVTTAFKSCSQSKLNPFFLIPSKNYMFGPHLKDPDYKRAPPFPYETKNYGLFQRMFEGTTWRFDDNTKLIIIDGPPAVGKTELAKNLALGFDMKHMEDATMDQLYINSYGHDFRDYNDQLPEDLRSFDEKDFCQNPKGWNAAFFQVMKYKIRYSNYIDALTHILNTGQGVVMERSPYSDYAFAEAMLRNGFMSKKAFWVYTEIRRHTLWNLMKPHAVIYLDIPVPVVQQRIKERGLPHEKNSPALNEKFLSDLDNSYKTVLEGMKDDAEVLVYDWTEFGDHEVVIEDLEKVDFDKYTSHSQGKFKDWRLNKEKDYCDIRTKYTNHKMRIMTCFNLPIFDAPELINSGADEEVFLNLHQSHERGGWLLEGYNEHLGDTGIFWKTKIQKDKQIW